jgi:SAM-dependent methyltransferase
LNTRDHVYESIGVGYSVARSPDPRIHQLIVEALGDAQSVLNVGAGAGNYEPTDRRVVAVEPSSAMISQRHTGAGPALRGVAEALPFRDGTFDAALATFTLHHWTEVAVGLREMRRVSDRQVVLLFEPKEFHKFWLVEYFPEWMSLLTEIGAPSVDYVREYLEVRAVIPVPVPTDCVDGFAGAYWGRPEAYLDPAVRASISSLALLSMADAERGTQRLRDDLESGAWDDRFGCLRELPELDLGYRLVVAE